MLEIRLLGDFEVRRDGAPVEIASRPSRLLLAYLALTAGTPQPRARVAGILWPDSDETSARSNLRQALWRLRKAIGAGYLPSDNKVVSFEGGPESRLDISALEDPTESDLVAAVAAYKGELLPGYYEDWVLLERERLRAAFEHKIQRLLDSLVRKQTWSDVLRWAEHWIAFGQVPEPAYRALMIANAAQGDQASVAIAYERCCSDLKLEVGVEPSKETRRLYDKLLRGEGPAAGTALEPAKSKSGQRHNLPQQSNPFIGREHELAEARQLLSTGRLLTILGPGGMGKTRLALELARQMIDQFHNGVYLISLAPISSAVYLVQTIAETIGFPLSTDETPKRQLLRHLRNRQYLLLLDNFEHLLDGAGLVAEIVTTAKDVTVLITSRERLNIQEESLLSIDGLAYPSSLAAPQALSCDAVQLFINSARRLRTDFALRSGNLAEVARICQMVQGMPLGILLAAAWIDMLSPAEIADEMSRSQDFLRTEWRDVPERHRSIRAVIESSWRRLTETQRELLAKLAVFRGGFTLEAAQEVTGASLLDLASLVRKSLVGRDLESGRYGIHELLRQFAWDSLAARPRARQTVTEAHANYFANFMEQHWPHLTDSRQVVAMAEIETDLENVRRAWRFWLKRHDAGRIEQFLNAFWQVHEVPGWFNAGAELFADAAAALRPALVEAVDADSEASFKVPYALSLAYQAFFLAHLGDVEKGLDLVRESNTILQDLGRLDLIAITLEPLRRNAIYAGVQVATMDIGRKCIEFTRKHGDEWKLAYALCGLGEEAGLRRDYEMARRLLEEGLRLFEERGDRIFSLWPSVVLGHMAIGRGEYDEARRYYERALRACDDRSSYNWGRVKSLRYLGIVASVTGKYEVARDYFLRCLRLAEALGLPQDVLNVLYEMAMVEAASGDKEMSVRLLALVKDHPLSDKSRIMSLWEGSNVVRFRDLANELLAELQSCLPPETYAAAIERGRVLTLENAVLDLLNLRST